ncbi:MAG: carbohydrate-binding protein, partial [Planctomycetota bacterium]
MTTIRTALTTALLSLSATLAAAQSGDTIWIEGESSTSHNMRRHGWYDSVTKKSLSGGEWLCHFGEGDAPEAEYTFEATEGGEYYFWIRANSVARPRLSYRLGGGSWVEVDLGNALENLNIASDGKPDMRFISWINAGKVTLPRGPQTIRFKFHSANSNQGAIDCFLFSKRPFLPRGPLKPGARSGKANPGYFAWEPEVDDFRDDALIDLRRLNEPLAGQHGYVKAVGNDFRLASGEKVKFWGANVGPALCALDHTSHVYLARNLAKHGVNLVRLHGGIYGERNPAVDRRRLDNLHHMVSALRQEGIYVKLSFYFPLWFHLDGDQRPFMLIFFDDQMHEIYFNWADKLLNTENPYTGVPLGRDPSVAMVEVVNEDSHFFWTFGKKNMPQHRWLALTRLFGDWLKKKYGSIDKAVDAWGG